MTPLSQFEADWPAVSALLDEALDLPASEQASWLDSLAGEQAVHRQALRQQQAQRGGVETDDFLGALPELRVPGAPRLADGLAAGAQVGPYRLMSEIGRGGMGTVWLAERSDGLMKRRVALKLPRNVWGETFAERLAREREILAGLEHEHIARLYDAGVDAQGRPFLAMEYVEGESIDAYCRGHAPGLGTRLGLLLQVMTAVSHAHARLVVHRDLKPANILVTRDGQVKLLDFGIAKLLEGDHTQETALTELGGRALTPDYASPEQIRGEPLGTASDIYSMAVVAYELLTGERPYRLKRASAAELEEAIASVEPALASTRAADRRTRRQLRGDLDSILNKALKKAPGERYATMDAFAQDLQRHLAGAPVQARPDRLGYRAAKFLRRYRIQAVAGATVALALVAGASVALWQAHEAGLSAERAQAEAAKARVDAATAKAVQGFIESVFSANSRFQNDPEAAAAVTARELLDRGAERIDKDLATAPEARLRLYEVLADMYTGMGLYDRGLDLDRRGLALATQLHGAGSEAALIAAAGLGQTLNVVGQRDESLATLLTADAAASARPADDDRVRMLIDTNLAQLYFGADMGKGLARARRAAAIARRLGPSLEGISALSAQGDFERKSGHLEEARKTFVETARWIELQGADGVLSTILASLGNVQDDLGLVEAAGETLGKAAALAERLGEENGLHGARFRLANYQYRNGLLREALATAKTELAWARANGRDQSFRDLPALVMTNYARTLVTYGDAAAGLAAHDEARGLLAPQATAERRGQLLGSRADALVSLGRLAEAGADLDRAEAATGKGGFGVAESVRVVRRRYLVAIGKADEALKNFLDNPPVTVESSSPFVLLRRQPEHAMLLLASGDHDAARTMAAAALATIEALPERRFARHAQARLTAVLGEALLKEDRYAEALPVLQKSLALHLAQYDTVHSPAVAYARLALAKAERLARR
ncbi:MAG: serine/threonine protein kinase [Rubrivivax sp.]|nr:MAG: serine/threonine protein kinase [Rubrivivax sp.]